MSEMSTLFNRPLSLTDRNTVFISVKKWNVFDLIPICMRIARGSVATCFA